MRKEISQNGHAYRRLSAPFVANATFPGLRSEPCVNGTRGGRASLLSLVFCFWAVLVLSSIASNQTKSVELVVERSPKITSYHWDFGDGATSNSPQPWHDYKSPGLYEVSLLFADQTGTFHVKNRWIRVQRCAQGVDRYKVAYAEPYFKDFESLGFWSAGFANSPSYGERRVSDRTIWNQRRVDELEEMGIGFVYPSLYWDGWYEEKPENYHRFLADLRARGIDVGAHVAEEEDWYREDDLAGSKDNIFDPSGAIAKFKATDRNGDGISDLDGKIGAFYMGHEIPEYATQEERQKMYQIIKEYFPTTTVYSHFGSALDLPFVREKWEHPEGGTWGEYGLGPGEADAICFFIDSASVRDSDGQRRFDLGVSLRSLLRQKRYADSIAPELPLWVGVSLPGEARDATPEEMWSGQQIKEWAKMILSVGDVQRLIFRAYGRFKYDLAYGQNTDDPGRPESGFIEQREAVRRVTSWARNGPNRDSLVREESAEAVDLRSLVEVVNLSGSAPLLVQLKGPATSVLGKRILRHVWDLGDGTVSEKQTVIHDYGNAGQYTARLTVEDDAGNVDSANISIYVHTREWVFGRDNSPIVENLGRLWSRGEDGIYCFYGVDGGQTSITLPDPPDGIYDLWLLIYRGPRYRGDPHARFAVDGEVFDFVPAEYLGYEWVKVKPVTIKDREYTFTIDDVKDGGIILRGIKLEEISDLSESVSITSFASCGDGSPLRVQFAVTDSSWRPSVSKTQ